ncbi:methyltransferase domain-containing protein [Streptomyces lincolnensis]|uniref:methyltransferase domain-containing protein n=1 Tax=Streptomyces lincolnensis TaxID=1915 RepID=UPI0037D1179C
MSKKPVKDGDGPTSEELIAILDVIDRLPEAEELRSHSYDLLGIDPGTRIVDVGCGAGRAVAEMSTRGAQACGVDVDSHMIATARQRWPTAHFTIADACELPFADRALDGYRAEKVYHNLNDASRALEEARRVLVPGGRLVLIGQDWDTFVIDSDDCALTRTIVHARADQIPSPRVARSYRNLLLDAGFQDVAVDVRTGVFTDEMALFILSGLAEGARASGAISRHQSDGWIAEQRERAQAGRLFLAVPVFIAAATRA